MRVANGILLGCSLPLPVGITSKRARFDPNANISSFRPDHGTIGSYDAWPAQVMQAQLTMGSATGAVDALATITRIAPTTYEGPFGQARTLIQDDGTTTNTAQC
jgi:hypothetical protein